jgi:hypothetical protein
LHLSDLGDGSRVSEDVDMPVHDWTRVFPGTFHDFHASWIIHLKEALNSGVLPAGYYALAEQHAGAVIPDVLTLTTRRPEAEPPQGAVALAEAPPRVSVHECPDEATMYRQARRTLAIRHRSNRRLVAMIEVVSPGNKDGEQHLEEFVDKAVEALRNGIHLLVIDLNPPGECDPQGMHAAIWSIVGGRGFELPANRPLTLAAYMADRRPQAFVEPRAVGQPLPDMPLFLAVGWYVNVPLEATYSAAYAGLPSVIKDVVEDRAPPEWQEQ